MLQFRLKAKLLFWHQSSCKKTGLTGTKASLKTNGSGGWGSIPHPQNALPALVASNRVTATYLRSSRLRPEENRLHNVFGGDPWKQSRLLTFIDCEHVAGFKLIYLKFKLKPMSFHGNLCNFIWRRLRDASPSSVESPAHSSSASPFYASLLDGPTLGMVILVSTEETTLGDDPKSLNMSQQFFSHL